MRVQRVFTVNNLLIAQDKLYKNQFALHEKDERMALRNEKNV